MSRSDIDALNTTFVQGLEKGDAVVMASVYAPDARLLPPGSPPLTGDGIQRFWQGVVDQGVDGGALRTVSLEERDDLAVEEGAYEMRAGGTVVQTGKYVVVHRRQPDGSWRWATDIYNADEETAAG
ncbi:YybH family protein [Geodermatophilus sp. CPCC 206100]|uniref:YybH family protein n=1 Tax=Geodermatophilus sp. CPCC 206100 TaxID=3020054 RepID=UPI003B002D7C